MQAFNQEILSTVLAARHLTLKDVSERMKITETELSDFVAENPPPNAKLVTELSSQLSVPTFVFYMGEAPDLGQQLVDFRQTNPSIRPKLPPTVEAIALAERLQEVAAGLQHEDTLPEEVDVAVVKTADYANKIRAQLGISVDDQVGAKDSAAFYSICRAAIEKKGVFVVHESFPSEDGSGFCLAKRGPAFIVVNTKNQNHGRRNFTLCHELAHALIGRSGVSDPFVTKNSVELSCSIFAARFLAPQQLAREAFIRYGVSKQPSVDQIYRCSNYLKISQEATVVRFEQLKLVDTWSHRRWLAAVRSIGNPDFTKKGGGGGNIPQEKVKLAKYGFAFAKVFGRALSNGSLTPLEIYRMSGLKPKYQKPYFDFASNAGPSDADD